MAVKKYAKGVNVLISLPHDVLAQFDAKREAIGGNIGKRKKISRRVAAEMAIRLWIGAELEPIDVPTQYVKSVEVDPRQLSLFLFDQEHQ